MNENKIEIFRNEEFGTVRTLTIDEKPYFVGKDVAEILGYAKPRNAIATHEKPYWKEDLLVDYTCKRLIEDIFRTKRGC